MRIIQQWSDIFHDSKLILDISGVANKMDLHCLPYCPSLFLVYRPSHIKILKDIRASLFNFTHKVPFMKFYAQNMYMYY